MENGEKGRGITAFLSVSAFVVACAAIVICIGMGGRMKKEKITDTERDDIQAASTLTNDVMYKATIENGAVVIRNADGDIVRTLKTPVKLMADADREYFEAGVDIYSDKELDGLCEDFEG